MKILITGGAGFIGSHVCDILREQGHEPVIFDIIHGNDTREYLGLSQAIAESDGVIHLAGILGTQETVEEPMPAVTTNVLGGLNVFRALREHNKPGVYIAVGNYTEINPYSISKTTAEKFAIMYAREHKVNINVVRGLNAYGPRQKFYPVRKIIASFVTRTLNGSPIQIYGDGEQKMDLIYVRDLAEILVDVLLTKSCQGVRGNVYEAGTGVGPTVNEIAKEVIETVGSDSAILLSEIEHLPMRPGETVHAAVIAQNPYPHTYTSLKDGLVMTVDWYKENKNTWSK